MQRMEVSAWELETNAKIILTKLGIQDFYARIGSSSGGYRALLGSCPLSEPDVLLMDEPNHLDALSVEWLQSYLNRYRGAILLITHDRYFLDRVTNRIIEIDRGDIYTYAGNYSYYLEKKLYLKSLPSAASAASRRCAVSWNGSSEVRKPVALNKKARIDRVHDMQATEFKQVQSRYLHSVVASAKVIELTNISKGYGDRTLIKDFTYEFSPEDRIGIIGGNGAGKSTLMDIIT